MKINRLRSVVTNSHGIEIERLTAAREQGARRNPDKCLHGIRHLDGRNSIWACLRNRRSIQSMISEKDENP